LSKRYKPNRYLRHRRKPAGHADDGSRLLI